MAAYDRSAPILIVDDDSDNGHLFVDLLEGEGYATQLVHSGRAAIQVLRGGLRPRALLLDYHLGDMDATQLLPSTTAERSGIPVLIVSADHAAWIHAHHLGVAWVGFKPLDLTDVVTQLAAALADQ